MNDHTMWFASVCKCVTNLRDVLDELRLRLSFHVMIGGEQVVALHRGRAGLPSRAAGNDTCRFGCQVDGT